MRVLIVETAGNLWGSERALLDLIDSAPDLAFAVCCPPGSAIISELERRRVEVLPYFTADLHRKGRWSRLWAAIGVLRAAVRFRPALVHLNQSGGYRVVRVAARLLKIPIICHVRIFEDAKYLAEVSPDPDVLRGIIAVSMAVAEDLRSHPELTCIPIHCLYDAYAATGQSTPRGVRQPKLACVGRITPIKGQEVLLGALASTIGFPAFVECNFAGDGDATYVSRLKTLSEGSPVTVTWLGFMRDVSPLLQASAVLVCPSHREPLGRVILEAWDAGAVPVVFAGAGGAAEIVKAAQGGILYSEQSPLALGEALKAALALSDEEAHEFVSNGRAWMRDNCILEAYGQRIFQIFSEAIPKMSGDQTESPLLSIEQSDK